MAPVAERFRRVLLSPSASGPQISGSGEFVFRNWPSDEMEGRTLADFAAYTLHASRVLVVSERNPYAEGFASVFIRRFAAEGRAAALEVLDPARPQGDALARLAGPLNACQVVVLSGYASDLLPLLNALRTRTDLPPVLSTSALSQRSSLRDAAMDGVLFARPAFDPEGDTAAAEFSSLYAAKFGQEADIYAAHAYDAVKLLAEVMSKTGSGASGLQQGLLSVRNYQGAAGSTTFDSNGDVIQPFQVCAVEDGRAVPLKSVVERVLPPLQQRVQSRRFGR
jgi:ABC-type branched-subunit amino acid transport system substrate-binding protein